MIQFPGATKAGGQALAFPDVCKVPAAPSPPIPTPFPNMGQVRSTSGTIAKVQFANKDVVVESSKISSSSGDEAGTLKGLISSTTGSEVSFRRGSSKVLVAGKAAVVHTAPTAHNGSNANAPPGMHADPSQTKVLVAL